MVDFNQLFPEADSQERIWQWCRSFFLSHLRSNQVLSLSPDHQKTNVLQLLKKMRDSENNVTMLREKSQSIARKSQKYYEDNAVF